MSTKLAKQYLKEFKKAKKAGKLRGFPTWGQWKRGKGGTTRTKAVSSQLKDAGLSYSEIMKFRGK